ncbi:FUSC family protein [Kitasatospora xanthocidica]|uniref:FUSC family protein n=1 Tax=Kitasatospora xanthocidica TaxID=83382 RepID=A0A372ZYZ1_9ACTN|nr:FUSC family protein [Kitasatospora xanthocidica]RGD60415.1 FUSC family protein [Kitasatospora xanthocidica]
MVTTAQFRQALRVGPAGDGWHKPALSAVVTLGALNLTLLGLGRLDLALYTSAGGLGALYGHGLPYRARARMLVGVLLGTVLSTGAALTAAALTRDAAVLVAVAAVLAALHKLLCDAARVGPPGSLIITFTSSSCAFVPQRLGEVPPHLALTALGAALAWLVCMAPALVRPYGPEWIATARALEAAARLLRSDPGRPDAAARTALVGAVEAARQSLALSAPARRRALGDAPERLLVRAEAALAGPARPEDAGWYLDRARELRRGRPLPSPDLTEAEAAETEAAAARRPGPRPPLRRALRPGSALLPIALRVAVGCAAAGWLSLALGVGRPYWAVVTAASVFQANSTLSWQRALQRVLGNLLGLLLFTAALPVAHSGPVALIGLGLLCQFGAEATIARSYWLATVFVTPMALLMTEFAGPQPAGTLVADRWLDTCVGALTGLAACLLVTNRRTATRLTHALAGAEAAGHRALAAVSTVSAASAPEARAARTGLAAALLELREATDTAAGEWRRPALPHQRAAATEQWSHHLLAALLERRGRGDQPDTA